MCFTGQFCARFALKVVQDRGAHVDDTLVVWEVKAPAHANVSDERIKVVLLGLHAVDSGEGVAQYLTVGEFGLRVNKGYRGFL